MTRVKKNEHKVLCAFKTVKGFFPLPYRVAL
jgi:hypothetical protein